MPGSFLFYDPTDFTVISRKFYWVKHKLYRVIYLWYDVVMARTGRCDPFIYGLADPQVDDEVLALRYVGQTRVGMDRPRAHFRVDEALRNDGNKHKSNWIRKLKRSGKLPEVVVLERVPWNDDIAELKRCLDEAECRLIARYENLGSSLLNIQAGGTSGYILSNEEKEKISKARAWVPTQKTLDGIDLSTLFGSWSSEKAWWLGVTFSHGRTMDASEKRTVALTTRFIDLAEKWRDVAGAGSKLIRWRDSCWIIEIGDVRLARWVIEQYGLHRRWTDKLEWPSGIPEEFAMDFIRGLWDAKAHMQFKERAGRQPMVRTSVESSSWVPGFADELVSRIPGAKTYRGAIDRSGEKAVGVAVRGAATVPFLDSLYRDVPDRTCCSEQREKAAEISSQWKALLRSCRACGSDALVGRDLCRGCSQVKHLGKACSCGNSSIVAKGLCRACYQRQYSKGRKDWFADRSAVKFLKEFDVTLWQAAEEGEQRRLIESVVAVYREKGFPWFDVDDADPSGVVASVARGKVTVEDDAIRSVGYAGQRLCHKAHPHRLKTSYRGHSSVVDAFGDDRKLTKAIALQLRYGDPVTPRRVLRALSAVYKAPTNFPPALARWLADAYAPQDGVVFDPCAGFGGRLLGVVSSQKNLRYIGNDIEPNIVAGNVKLAELVGLSDRATVTEGDALMVSWSESDLVMMGPPYFDRESYGAGADASAARFATAEHWVNEFLGVLVKKAMVSAPVAVLNLGSINRDGERIELPSMAVALVERLGFVIDKSWQWILPTFGNSAKAKRDERLLVIKRL